MKLKERQAQLDEQKYLESKELQKDKTGKMEYCIKCKYRNYPFLECCITHERRVQESACAKAFNQMMKEKR